MDIGFKPRIALADRTQHQQEIEHCSALFGDHLPRHHQRNPWRIRQDHVRRDFADQLIQLAGFHVATHLLLEHLVWRQLHFWQHIKSPLHQTRQIVPTDQAIEIVSAFKVGQATQQAHRLGFINADTEQEQQIIRAGFLHHDTAFVQVFRYQRCRYAALFQRAKLIHPRRQDGDLDRIEIHVIAVGIAKAVPVVVRV